MNESAGPSVIVVLGPTACGKTAFAVRLARVLGGEIISADSRQVYMGLNIGSGKDLDEYAEGGNPVRTHLLDIVDPAAGEPYTLADFMRDAKSAITDISVRGRVPILCGGTALYLHALMKGYVLPGGPADRQLRSDLEKETPEALSARLAQVPDSECGETSNPYRLSRRIELERSDILSASSGGPLPGARYQVFGVFRPREEIRTRIERRLDERFAQGMLDEVAHLHDVENVSWEKLESFGLEYREIALHLQGKTSFDEMRERLLVRIRQFAKRQDTFFRKMEREGIEIHWTSPDDFSSALEQSREFLLGK